ncbi:MAG: HEAT repeat domain-containing protein [Prosthecobacter sp.]|uniref:HEAT repeat domain-containing protein n=1 Tax=Prosthecobacter sp. TaxID=1965333 RepID=UPI0039042D1F
MSRRIQIICLMAGLFSAITLLVFFGPGSGDAALQGTPSLKPAVTRPQRSASSLAESFTPAPASQTTAAPSLDPATASRLEEVRRLVALGPDGVADIIRRLASAASAEEKAMLCDALVQIGTDEAMQAFANAVLTEKDPATRGTMLSALDATSKPAALELATSFLSITNDPTVLSAVNRTLARMGNADTVQFLTELYAENEAVAGQRQGVLSALGSLRNPQVVTTLGALVSQSPVAEISQAGSLSLSKIGTADALTSLVEALGQLPESRVAEREAVIQQISAIRNPESAALLASLATTSTDLLIQHAASEALKQIPPAATESVTPSAPVARPEAAAVKIIP